MSVHFMMTLMVIGVYSRHQVSPRGPPYAVFDSNKPTKIAYDEGTFKYPFKTTEWYSATTANGLSIDKSELDNIYYEIGKSMEGGYASLETYIKPDTISSEEGAHVYGAWKVQILVKNFVWKYKIAQGEGYVTCKQDWQDKVSDESTFMGARITWDVWYNYWTAGATCTFQIVSPLIPQVLMAIDTDWDKRMIGHSEL
eukprot:394157_1